MAPNIVIHCYQLPFNLSTYDGVSNIC